MLVKKPLLDAKNVIQYMNWSKHFQSLDLRDRKASYDTKAMQVKRGWELMRVEKWEFVWEFSQLSCPGQTRMKVDESWEARVCMRVFLILMSWSNDEDESWWELRSESLHESFLNYHILVKRGWELMRVEKREFVWVFSTIMSWSNGDESWWELRSESLYESFLNYHVQGRR